MSVITSAVLVVVLAIVCGVGARGTIPTLITHTPSPTSMYTSALAARSQAHSVATLGGTLGDFVQRYGTPIDDSCLMYAATLADQRVLITLTLVDPNESQDGQQHVVTLAVQVPGDALGTDTWSQENADQIAQTFLPPDALFQHIVTTGKIHDHVYHSASMAQTFTADQFTNDLGNVQAPIGTLSYSCHAWPPSASGLGQCLIAIGSYAAP